MTEAQLQAKFLKYANALDKTVARKYPGTGLVKAGMPDVLVARNGVTVYIEFKKPGKYFPATDGLSAAQERCIRKLREAGQKVLVTDSFNEAKEWLDEHCSTGRYADPD